jgi:hypothetical protein
MKNKRDSSNKERTDESKNENNIIVSVELTIGDMVRLKKAFAEGKLKDLGVVGISMNGEAYNEVNQNWQQKERERKNKPNNRTPDA